MMKRQKNAELKMDVAVIGGGLSGVCAAIASARHGAKTVLIHDRPVLGGNASSEIRMHICGADANGMKPDLTEGGILHEILLENVGINSGFSYAIWDAVLYQAVKSEENLEVYFNTAFYRCETKEDSIVAVDCFQFTTELELHIVADYFIDCTGNGTLGYFAGADYREGSEAKAEFHEPHAPEKENNFRMGNTLLLKAEKRDSPITFIPPKFAKKLTEEQLKYRPHCSLHEVNIPEECDEDTFRTFCCGSTRGLDYGYWWLELTGESDDFVGEYEKVKDDLLGYIYGVWDHIKNGGKHDADNYELVWVGMLPGMRESRRLMGDYILTENDVFENRRFADAVAYGGWPVDIHAPNGLLDFHLPPSEVIRFDGTYTIPWRSYYSRNIKNLMMAGRNISTSRLALGSARVMGTCAIGGQAVGTGAALCVKYQCLPKDLSSHMEELQRELLKDDAFIPDKQNQDETDLALSSSVVCSSYQNGFEPENVINGISRSYDGCNNAWRSKTMSKDGEWIQLKLAEPKKVSLVQITFDSGFGKQIRITLSDTRRSQQKIGSPDELCKDFIVRLKKQGKIVGEKLVKDNRQRLCRIGFEQVDCDTVEIRILSTYGCEEARIFETRIYQ